MKLFHSLTFGLVVSILNLQAAHATPAKVDDNDLSGATQAELLSDELPSSTLTPDQIFHSKTLAADAPVLVIQLEEAGIAGLTFKNAAGYSQTTDESGQIFLPQCSEGDQFDVVAQLRDNKIVVQNAKAGDAVFEVKTHIYCGQTINLVFKKDSLNGQPLGIWKIAYTAKEKLRAAVGLDWWTNVLPFSWPASADYYSWGTVNVTRGDHWDVVGHEMGHGIYDMANIGGMGGGEHKIDQCYSATLALSEGWASYFSAWISVDLNDADAKFEFMVPRRAPIRFETIPADVCAGEQNEWRVTGFFWDLIDVNHDAEGVEASFAQIWQALLRSRSNNLLSASQRLQRSGMNAALLDLVWELNLLTTRATH